MKTVLWYLCCIIIGYLLGNINTAAIIARCKGFDIRTKGSGNAGASNALLTMGKGAAACSAVVDIFKAFIPVWLLLHIISFPETCRHLPVATGISVIFGHMFPFWMQFRGGKGFASLLGLILALSWKFFFVCIAILAVILIVTKFIALATMTCAVVLPVFWYSRTGCLAETVLFALLAVVIICKHIPNLQRIANGTEIPSWVKKHEPRPDDNAS